jgi:hypothetical protein
MGTEKVVSFSRSVKDELTALPFRVRHCAVAELSALLCLRGASVNGRLTVKGVFAKARVSLLKEAIKAGNADLLKKLDRRIPRMETGKLCCKAAYLRGVFICRGAVSRNHLELALGERAYAQAVAELIAELDADLNAKITERKDGFAVYLKDGERISTMLGVMGAHRAMLEYENMRIKDDVNNGINRRVNFLQANMDKIMDASVSQLEDILLIERTAGLSSLPPDLEETARLRLENPEMSLAELGRKLSRPVGKSGAGHRLRKIKDIAEGLN